MRSSLESNGKKLGRILLNPTEQAQGGCEEEHRLPKEAIALHQRRESRRDFFQALGQLVTLEPSNRPLFRLRGTPRSPDRSQ